MPATIWICLVEGPSGEQRIRAWTPDADRAEAFRKEGLEMQEFSAVAQAERPYCDPVEQGKAFYLAMYEKKGAIWNANEHQELWVNLARDYERRRREACSVPSADRS